MVSPEEKALEVLFKNFKSVKENFDIGIPPSDRHYVHTFLWDSCFVAIVLAYFGRPDLGEMQIKAVLSGQMENGFIPNMKFGKGRYLDPERFLFKNYKKGSDYTQPPLLAHAVFEIYKKYGNKGKNFLSSVYKPLQKYYSFLDTERTEVHTGPLIACIHPHETGRDSDPLFDEIMKKKKMRFLFSGTNLIVGRINTLVDYMYALRATRNLSKKEKTFWLTDVMVNCIYAENIFYMAKVARILNKKDDEKRYLKWAHKIEEAILTHMEEDEICYPLFFKEKIRFISISNLFPIILEAVPKEYVIKILSLLDDPSYFNTPYPIPSVPKNSIYYDGGYTEKRLWRGPVWINTNWYIVEGLWKQYNRFRVSDKKLALACLRKANHIAQKTEELVQKGCFEFYNPETGKGMRIKSFAWSTLGYLLEDKLRVNDFL